MEKVTYLQGNFETYYDVLGISKDRAMELIAIAQVAYTLPDISQAMEFCTDRCNNTNEIVFTLFKLGELSGISIAIKEPAEAVKLMAHLESQRE